MEEQIVYDHIRIIKEIKLPKDNVCGECIKIGSVWVHLRTCQTCGITFCCDASPNQHVTKHYRPIHHPVIISAEPGEKWMWCYPDEIMAEYS